MNSIIDGQVRAPAPLQTATCVPRQLAALPAASQISRRKLSYIIRTLVDMVKLFPFIVILAAPGGTLLLPIAVKYFPGLLPSAFERCAPASTAPCGVVMLRCCHVVAAMSSRWCPHAAPRTASTWWLTETAQPRPRRRPQSALSSCRTYTTTFSPHSQSTRKNGRYSLMPAALDALRALFLTASLLGFWRSPGGAGLPRGVLSPAQLIGGGWGCTALPAAAGTR